MNDDYRIRLSKFISLILRHHPEKISITLDSHGWADVHELLDGINHTGRYRITFPLLKEIVTEDEKQRYSFNEDQTKIRASQGHSIPVDVEPAMKKPPSFLYHGTAEKNISSILEKGLLPMGRLYVHLSTDTETAIKTGMRHGVPAIFIVEAESMYNDGYPFHLSANSIWMTKFVPSSYLFLQKCVH